MPKADAGIAAPAGAAGNASLVGAAEGVAPVVVLPDAVGEDVDGDVEPAFE
jgi:hypothetical protein